MTLHDLQNALEANPKRFPRFVLPNGDYIPAHAHVTEVGHVARSFVDCGGLTGREEKVLLQIYQCFCDRTRLRILHLLTRSPLCVCHFQDILGEPQVKISKHLAYLRDRGMVTTKREQNWIIYSLPGQRAEELERNLKCL